MSLVGGYIRNDIAPEKDKKRGQAPMWQIKFCQKWSLSR